MSLQTKEIQRREFSFKIAHLYKSIFIFPGHARPRFDWQRMGTQLIISGSWGLTLCSDLAGITDAPP